jgi:ATP-dependent RNA helicase DDX41
MIMVALEQERKMPIVRGEGPLGLCINPSRELARQTHDVILEHTDALRNGGYPELRCLLAMGGIDMREQQAATSGGAHMCVATPGRLMDMLGKKRMSLDLCRYLALDEADRMIDMGFEDEGAHCATQFTCFPGTKVQILTPEELLKSAKYCLTSRASARLFYSQQQCRSTS